jgi:WD40 repeat protein
MMSKKISKLAWSGEKLVIADRSGDVYDCGIDDTDTRLVLGHVSMLLDVAVTTHENKEYIITADRDEHVRVSEYPNGYNILHYLQGHLHYVNRLLVMNKLLVSAGGDDYMFVWNWEQGELMDRIPLDFGTDTVNVISIRPLDKDRFAVLGENSDKMLFFKKEEETIVFVEAIPLNGQPLDIAYAFESIIIATDQGLSCKGRTLDILESIKPQGE